MRQYKGIISHNSEQAVFIQTGYWIAYGNKKVGSYKRIDREDPCQYSRSRNNVFYIESVD